MNKKVFATVSLLIILAFIGYIIYDTATSNSGTTTTEESNGEFSPPDQWAIYRELAVFDGPLLSVAVSVNDNVYLGGESYENSISSATFGLYFRSVL